MTPQEVISRLCLAFPRSRIAKETLALYQEQLAQQLDAGERERALSAAITRSKFMPSLAELIAWGQGKEPGKGKAKQEREKGWDRDTVEFIKREVSAQKRGDQRELDFLARVRRAWHAARWRNRHGSLHPCDYGLDLETELDQLGMNFDGSTQNGRPHHELATVGEA